MSEDEGSGEYLLKKETVRFAGSQMCIQQVNCVYLGDVARPQRMCVNVSFVSL